MTISFPLESGGMLNLDTHILIKVIEGGLRSDEHSVLTMDPQWGVSAVVLWEIEKLYQTGRLQHGLDYPPLAELAQRIHIWPITREICLNLRSLDFKSDPADELIAATSLTHDVPLVTRDARLRISKVIRCL